MISKLLKQKTLQKVAIFVAVLTLSTAPFADAQQSKNNQRDLLNMELNEINKKINSYQKQISTTKQQQASLKNEIFIYDSQIASLELQMQANETERLDTNLQIEELEIQIERRTREMDDNKVILGKLMVQLSQLDNASFINISLGNDNFSAFLDQVEYTRSVQNQVYSLVKRIKEIRATLEIQQNDLKGQLAKLEELKEQLKINQEVIEQEKVAKDQLLAQTKGLESSYQKLLSQSKGEQNDILQEINSLNQTAQAAGGQKITTSKGALGWPMDGTLTQGYGNTGFTSLGYNFHNGLDIAAPAGKPIYASADGVVAHCDQSQAAYGNWCTIRHSITTSTGTANVVTLYAHMRSYNVAPGQAVKRGDLVGYEGNSGNTTRLLYGPDRGYHIHFTVFGADGYKVTKGSNTAKYGNYHIPSGFSYNPMNFLGK